jgi:hypothetical protein
MDKTRVILIFTGKSTKRKEKQKYFSFRENMEFYNVSD